LTTAAWLSDFGHVVTVCEQAAHVGGRLGSRVHGDLHFDLTPGPLTVPAVFRDFFRKTGRPLERVLDLVPVEPAISYQFPDGLTVDLPHSRAGSVRALDETFGTGAGAEWQNVIRFGGEIWARIRSPYLEASPTRRELASLARSRRRSTYGLDRSLRALGREVLSDPRPIRMLEHVASGTDPREAPAGLAAIAYLHQTFGRWTVSGGMHRLGAAIGERAAECGASIRTNARVAEILVDGRRASGVRLADGEVIEADVVVAGVDVTQLRDRLLTGRLTSRLNRRRSRSTSSPSRFTVFLAVRPGDLQSAAHHRVLFGPAGDAELDAVFGTPAAVPTDPAIDLYTPPPSTSSDPASDSEQPWVATATVPGHSDGGVLDGTVDWSTPGRAETYADHLIDVMAHRGLDLRDRLSWLGHRSPHDVATEAGIVGGGAWGDAATAAGGLEALTAFIDAVKHCLSKKNRQQHQTASSSA
jgi:phytoene dehydrogenase-like protein